MRDEIQKRLDLALSAARAAGDLTLRYFRGEGLEVETKSNDTPVTVADREAERVLRDRIASAFPDDAVVGEEHADTPGSSGFTWILDPIDGTVSFVHGVPLYGTLVAVTQEGRTVAGLIHMPALDETVHAALGGGAWLTRGGSAPTRARVREGRRLEEATVVMTSPEYFDWTDDRAVYDELSRRAKHTRGWSDCYGHLLVATGRADACVEPPVLGPWDIAPMTLIVAEAGGVCTDWEGEVSPRMRSAIAAPRELHEEVMGVVRGVRGR